MDLSLIPRAFLLAALALTASALAAAPPPPDPQEQEQIQDGLSGPEAEGVPPPPVKEQRPAPIRENLLDRPHDSLSRSVEAYSRKLDNFFSDPNRAYDSTGSALADSQATSRFSRAASARARQMYTQTFRCRTPRTA